MHQYILDTDYAVHSLIGLITGEEEQFVRYQSQHENAKEKEKHLHQQFMDSQFNDDVVPMQEQAKYIAWYGTHRELAELQRQITLLHMSIDFKSASIVALCGAVLQIAKQGISIVHSGLSNCPAGRAIGSEYLKNVIWHGRNQSMHYEEGRFSQAVRDCFSSLEISFGNKFSLDLNTGKNLAHDVIDILGWKDYSIYKADLRTLL